MLESEGCTVIRFWNNEVIGHVRAIMQVILDMLQGL